MKEKTEKPSFGNNFFVPCKYCKDFVISDSKRFGEDSYGCKIRTSIKGEYADITNTPSPLGESLFDRGCNDFISSGVTIHPLVLDELVNLNPKLATIPIENSMPGPYEIENQLRVHLPKTNFTWSNTIRDIPEAEIIKSR
jgi:hypothetical protein